MTAKMITVWYKYDDKGNEVKLNHIEDGWVNGEYPKPLDHGRKVIGKGNMLTWMNNIKH
ncbi:hypothetical protein ACFWBI_39825 [Streptomyces sp. NPDC059982]|uniref:hypothetical protein n=1 Tax=Streptomyces sp. NPDC059982 TaxID=3347024 RepID=UPI003695E2FE